MHVEIRSLYVSLVASRYNGPRYAGLKMSSGPTQYVLGLIMSLTYVMLISYLPPLMLFLLGTVYTVFRFFSLFRGRVKVDNNYKCIFICKLLHLCHSVSKMDLTLCFCIGFSIVETHGLVRPVTFKIGIAQWLTTCSRLNFFN